MVTRSTYSGGSYNVSVRNSGQLQKLYITYKVKVLFQIENHIIMCDTFPLNCLRFVENSIVLSALNL